MEILILPILVLLIPALYVLVQYNQLVGLKNYIQNAWSNIDTELKRRYDLIPNLVEIVKGVAKHEKSVLEQVVALRTRCIAHHSDPRSQAADERELVGALERLLAVAESYPDLKANRNYLELQKELVNTEDRIQSARRFYNGNVRDYRNKCEAFPSNMVAKMFHFPPVEFFSVKPAVREVPDVDF